MSGEAGKPGDPGGQSDISAALAAIRELVTAETRARGGPPPAAPGTASDVLVLTPQMRVDAGAAPVHSGEILSDGIAADHAPEGGRDTILDEAALRAVVNAIVRDELKGELGERISRNLRQLIRREIAQVMAERGTR